MAALGAAGAVRMDAAAGAAGVLEKAPEEGRGWDLGTARTTGLGFCEETMVSLSANRTR